MFIYFLIVIDCIQASPSGLSMPTTNLTGWTLAFSDDFSGSSLHYPSWFKYGGTLWDGSHVVVENGLLELQSYRDPNFNNAWKSGGVSTIQGYGSNSTYGKYLVRQRVDPGKVILKEKIVK